MQKLLILTSWFIIVYSIYNKLGKNSILIVLSISWWFFWNLISSFSISGLYPPGNKYQFILFILIIVLYCFGKVLTR